MTDRVPGAPGQYKAIVSGAELLKMQSAEEFTITMTRDDQPVTEGTPYSKAAVLPDALAQKLCPDKEDPTPADAFQALYDRMYPVGAIYMSVSQADPARLFGGTWERLKDRFLLAAGDTYEAGETGGEAAHKLSVEEMPLHAHDIYMTGSPQVDTSTLMLYDTQVVNQYIANSTTITTTGAGANRSHNNMPPYLAVYMWKRTA